MRNINDLISKTYYLDSNNPLGQYIRDLNRMSLCVVSCDTFRTALKEEIDRVASVLDSYTEVEYDKTFKVKRLVPPDRLIDKDQWGK